MLGLDCNILVQIAIADHPANTKTLSILQNEVHQGTKLVFPSLVVTEFLHVVTDPRRFDPPLSMEEALDWVQDFLSNPAVQMIESNEASRHHMFQWMRQFNLGRKRILDTHLAAIFHVNGVRRLLTSNPSDFRIFGELEIITP